MDDSYLTLLAPRQTKYSYVESLVCLGLLADLDHTALLRLYLQSAGLRVRLLCDRNGKLKSSFLPLGGFNSMHA